MNFLVWEMTYLRYFIPLILEGNKRGIRSKVFVDYSCHKYNSPKNNKDKLVALSQEYAFDLLPIEDASECTGVTFVIEGILREYCKKSTCVSIPYGTDFVSLWSKYINEVDHVIMPTEFIAQRYDRVSDKNLYWNNNEGWMTTTTIKNQDKLNQFAEVYTNTERKINNLPIDGEWVRYTENK